MKKSKFIFLLLLSPMVTCCQEYQQRKYIRAHIMREKYEKEEKEAELKPQKDLIYKMLCDSDEGEFYKNLKPADRTIITDRIFSLLNNYRIYINLCIISDINISIPLECISKCHYGEKIVVLAEDENTKKIIEEFQNFLSKEINRQNIVKFLEDHSDFYISKKLNEYRITDLKKIKINYNKLQGKADEETIQQRRFFLWTKLFDEDNDNNFCKNLSEEHKYFVLYKFSKILGIYGSYFWDRDDGDKKSIIDEIKKYFQDKSKEEHGDIVGFLENYTDTYLIEQFKEYKKKNNSK